MKEIFNKLQTAELLAPAGSYDSFLGALSAGADAVYLGGDRFSARAYADNFTVDDICNALRVAHFYGKKIYLTLNTLIKPQELDEVCDYVMPMYLAGLDGVIVQDLGVAACLRKAFPELELHASTQMFVTGSEGVELLKGLGFSRVVPARELTLNELRSIKETTGIELEVFIHGAMCYAYSGQCLFSSLLGARSGNRGRCAQPCRLPYELDLNAKIEKQRKNPEYPISLKDMCTLPMLPKILMAGMDSLKIEGRMKRPEYAAGVTAIYRKYLDRFVRYGAEEYRVDSKDLKMLEQLYVRSDLQTGYYQERSGKHMITPSTPAYKQTPDDLIQKIHEKYVHDPKAEKVDMALKMKAGEPACLEMRLTRDQELSVTVYGREPDAARSAPITGEQVEARLAKLGGTLFEAGEVLVTIEGDLFYPVGALNELRREAITQLEEKIISLRSIGKRVLQDDSEGLHNVDEGDRSKDTASDSKRSGYSLDVSVMTSEQLLAVIDSREVSRIYVDSDLWLSDQELCKTVMERSGAEWYLALPYVSREMEQDRSYLNKVFQSAGEFSFINGYLVRNLEQLGFLRRKNVSKELIICDAGLYEFNQDAYEIYGELASETVLARELSRKEKIDLASRSKGPVRSQIIYGRIPLMHSANCIKKTGGMCDKTPILNEKIGITDRYQIHFPVYCNCNHCYNTIYNSVPYSMLRSLEKGLPNYASRLRIDLVYEGAKETRRITRAFSAVIFEQRMIDDLSDISTTSAWDKKGVE